MLDPYAELIGDPVEHSLSPAIHGHWLKTLGLAGSYRAVRCPPETLGAYLGSRLPDPLWRGCNVTMPLKEKAAAWLDWLEDGAARSGAVNCIVPRNGRLHGFNTDIDALLGALDAIDMEGKRTVVLGSGGAARAALIALGQRKADRVVLARDPDKRLTLRALGGDIECAPLYAIREALEGAALIINATPLGMAGAEEMPLSILEELQQASPITLAIDLVYRPVETEFLSTSRAAGMQTVDGLTLLIGQARRAFELFFGTAPPPGDEALRTALLQAG